MEIAATTPTGSPIAIVPPEEQGFSGLTADDFMTLLITQLQNQDPSQPMENDALLSQLTTMQNLQSNVELSRTLQQITSNQQLSTASGFIGKLVTGTTNEQETVSGMADRAFLRDGDAFVGIGDSEVPLTGVTDVAEG